MSSISIHDGKLILKLIVLTVSMNKTVAQTKIKSANELGSTNLIAASQSTKIITDLCKFRSDAVAEIKRSVNIVWVNEAADAES